MSHSARALLRATPRLVLASRLACASSSVVRNALFTTTSTHVVKSGSSRVASIGVRFNSTKAEEPHRPTISQEEPPKVYDYQQIKDLTEHPQEDKIIVDVREPAEYQAGSIPGAINIPYKSTPGALDLSPEEFEEAFKFKKPSKDKELIFYCLAGVRSTAAADLAQMFGYKKLGNYIGSYQDWSSHEQPQEKPEEEAKNDGEKSEEK